VEEGIAGGAPGAPATFVAMGHLYFDSIDAFQAAFAPHAQSILADIPNYTNTQPTIQVSEAVVSVSRKRWITQYVRHNGRALDLPMASSTRRQDDPIQEAVSSTLAGMLRSRSAKRSAAAFLA